MISASILSQMLHHLITSRQQAFVLFLMLALLVCLIAYREIRRKMRQKPSIDSFGMDLLYLLKNKRRQFIQKITHKNKRAAI